MPARNELVAVFIRPALRTELIRLRGELIAREGRMAISYDDVIAFLVEKYRGEPIPVHPVVVPSPTRPGGMP